MTALIEHLRFEWRAAVRNPSQLLLSYLFPIGFFLLVGAILPDLNPRFGADMVPAFAVFALIAGNVLGLPSPMVEQRASGVLRAYRVLGVPDASAIGVPAASSMFHSLIAASVLSMLCPLLYGGQPPERWALYGLALALGAFALAGIGTLIGVVSSSSRATVLWSQLVFLPSTLLGGLMVPFAALPARARPLSMLLPSTHVLQLIDGAAYRRPVAIEPWVSALALAGCGVLCFWLSARLYNTEKRGLQPRKGLLVLLAFAPFALSSLAAL